MLRLHLVGRVRLFWLSLDVILQNLFVEEGFAPFLVEFVLHLLKFAELRLTDLFVFLLDLLAGL